MKLYKAIVWVGERAGQRVTVEAESPDEAMAKLKQEFGEDAVISTWNEQDADRLR